MIESRAEARTILLGLTIRRLICVVGESLFLLAGVLLGLPAIAALVGAMEDAGLEPPPLAQLGIDWYWVLLVCVAVHIALWPIVPRILGSVGVYLWYLLAVILPILILAVPTILLISIYILFSQDLALL